MSEKRTLFSIDALSGDLAETSRALWLAGLGAIASVEEGGTQLYESLVEGGKKLEKDSRARLTALQEEAEKVFDDLVARGEKVETAGRKQVEAVKDEVEAAQEDLAARPKAFVEKLEQTVAGSVEQALERLDVPTRTEVRTLTRKVDRLTKQVAALTARLEK